MKTFAAIVGVEQYADPTRSVLGPCTNAVNMIKWLLSVGTLPSDIYAFLAPIDDRLDDEIASLKERGINIRLDANASTLDQFFHQDLPILSNSTSRLLVYLSGHGATTQQNDRILLCSDFTRHLNMRTINVSNIVRKLRTSKYNYFHDQIVLADICATYSSDAISNRDENFRQLPRNQIALFASAQGKPTGGLNGEGVFTRSLLGALSDLGPWPDHERLEKLIRGALAAQNNAVLLGGFRDGDPLNDMTYGRPGDRIVIASMLSTFLALIALVQWLPPQQTSVVIDRYADFSASKCDAGQKIDHMTIADTYNIMGKSIPEYEARAEILPGQRVQLFDPGSGNEIIPSEIDDAQPGLITYHWKLKVVKGVAKAIYRWTNAYPANEEGLAFVSNYQINGIRATYLAPNADIKIISLSPAGIKCTTVENAIHCPDLNTRKRVVIKWNWSMWKNCPA